MKNFRNKSSLSVQDCSKETRLLPIPVSLMPVTLPWSVHSHLFFMKTSTGFKDGHIWCSIFSSSAWSNFTRVQRVSCCFSLLLCTMLTSIMFWGVPKDPAEQKMDLGNSHSQGMENRPTGSRHELSLPQKCRAVSEVPRLP